MTTHPSPSRTRRSPPRACPSPSRTRSPPRGHPSPSSAHPSPSRARPSPSRARRALALRAALVLLALAGAPAARAATITVDSAADEGAASAPNGTCTLREAVIAARADAAVDGCAAGSGPDVIVLPAGTYVLTRAGAGEDAAETGDLDLGDVTVQGAGAAATVVRGSGDRVFQVPAGAAATLAGIAIEQGSAQLGAGIYVDGSLTLDRCIVRGNAAASAGGGVFVSAIGAVTVIASTLAGNTAAGPGGGAVFVAGTLAMTNATVSGNTAGSVGGGLDVAAGATATLRSVTVASNAAADGGAGVYAAGLVTLADTLLAQAGASCAGSGSFTSGGHNLEAGGDSCGLDAAGDLPATAASLGDLQDNGGPTPTHALAEGSAAIDAGSGACPEADQRGALRPQDGDGDGAPACDIGAFEREGQSPRADLAVTLVAAPDPVRGKEPLGWSVTLVNAGPAPAAAVVVAVTLPPGGAVTSTWASQGACAGAGPVTCSLGALARGAEARMTVSTAAPAAAGLAEATATVASDTADPNPANDAATASVAVDPPYPAVVVSPPSASVAPGGSVAFAASGGSGTGWTWWLGTNASGATIDPATGAYTAGGTAGVTDVVQVNDSLGHVASATVAVAAPGTGDGGGGCGCGAAGGAGSLLALGALLLGRRRVPGAGRA